MDSAQREDQAGVGHARGEEEGPPKRDRGIRLTELKRIIREIKLNFFFYKFNKKWKFAGRVIPEGDTCFAKKEAPKKKYHRYDFSSLLGGSELPVTKIESDDITLEEVNDYTRFMLHDYGNRDSTYLDQYQDLASEPFDCAYVICPRSVRWKDLSISLDRHVQKKKVRVEEEDYYVWIDVFCSHDFLLDKNHTEEKEERLKTELQSLWVNMRKFNEKLVFVDKLMDPGVLNRLWCTWELFAACNGVDDNKEVASINLIFSKRQSFAKKTRVEFDKFLERVRNMDPVLMKSRNPLIESTIKNELQSLEKGFSLALKKIRGSICQFILYQVSKDINDMRPFLENDKIACARWYIDVATLILRRGKDSNFNQEQLKELYGNCIDKALEIGGSLPKASDRSKDPEEEERLVLLIEHAIVDTLRAKSVRGLNYKIDAEHIKTYMDEFQERFKVELPNIEKAKMANGQAEAGRLNYPGKKDTSMFESVNQMHDLRDHISSRKGSVVMLTKPGDIGKSDPDRRKRLLIDFEVRRLLLLDEYEKAQKMAYQAALQFESQSGSVYIGLLQLNDIRFKLGRYYYEQKSYAEAADESYAKAADVFAMSAEDDRSIWKKKQDQYKYRKSGLYESLAHYMNNKPCRALAWLDTVFFDSQLGPILRTQQSVSNLEIKSRCSKRSVQALELAVLCLRALLVEAEEDETVTHPDDIAAIELLESIIKKMEEQTLSAFAAVYGRRYAEEDNKEAYQRGIRALLHGVDASKFS